MNVKNFRVNLSAVAEFIPAGPGILDAQRIGWLNGSFDFPASSIAHVTKLVVTNFGTGGNTITINADTMAATIGAAAAAVVTGGAGKDSDGVDIHAAHWFFVGLRIVGGSAETSVILSSGDFELRAAPGGPPGIAAVLGTNLIAGAGTWTITGPIGIQDTPYTVEILAVGVSG